jgi:glucose-6-phosphate isomerase
MAEHLRAMTQALGKRTGWRALGSHYRKIRNVNLRELFADDPTRGERMAVEGAGIYLDYSKNRITDHTIKLLVQLAAESGLQSRIDSMFRGEKINHTQNRPALHVALRSPRGASVFVDGQNVVQQVQSVLDRMSSFCQRVLRGEWKGHTGKRIRNVVNVGTGTFALGPVMAYEALKTYANPSMTFRFVANVDGSDFTENVKDLDPSETLVILCCEDSATPGTSVNAISARAWLRSGGAGDQSALSKHLVVVSANPEVVSELGVDRANVFTVWDWVGGRYSLGSANGLSTMLAVGPENFRSMLDGLHQMDMHFLAAPFERNLPVLAALLSVWHVNFFGAQTIAILPYDQHLHRFPAYLQQLTMGSNGKGVTLIGTEVTQATAPVYWGEVGTLGFQSALQLMLQGTRLVPCDFIVFAKSLSPTGNHHDIVMANALAQSEALAFGRLPDEIRLGSTPDWLVPHLVCAGNRPSNTIFAEQLTPATFGKLISFYEHVVFAQGVIWNINSFDEWGRECGKELVQQVLAEINDPTQLSVEHDSSTSALIRRYRRFRGTTPQSEISKTA